MAASYTVGQIDEICVRINHLAIETRHSLAKSHEEQVVLEIVKLVQEVGEGVAWAYQHNKRDRGDFGEQFAQPFVDRKMQNVLKGLLFGRDVSDAPSTKQLRKDLQNRIAVQVLQTFHILLQATPADSLLFCSLTAGYYLNEVITAEYDFKESEDLLYLWMTLIKDIAQMLNSENIMLFFDPSSDAPFPIFSEAAKYYQHPASQVRTHVQAMSLDILSKFTTDGIRFEPLFSTLMDECRILCTHVCCLLREFWRMVDECITNGSVFEDERFPDGRQSHHLLPNVRERQTKLEGAKREMRNAMSIQNDILLYVGDLFCNEIQELNDIMQEKLLRVSLLPVLLRCMLRNIGHTDASSGNKEVVAPGTAAFLLFDALITLRGPCPAIAHVLAHMLLESHIPEEAQLVVQSCAPRTPAQFVQSRISYSRLGTIPSAWEKSSTDDISDYEIYSMPADLLPSMFELGESSVPVVTNDLLDAFIGSLHGLIPDEPPRPSELRIQRDAKPYGIGVWFLGVLAILLQTVNSDHDFFLAADVVPRLGEALCTIIAATLKTPWLITDTAMRCLAELAKAGDKPPGRGHSILAQDIRKMLLVPCAERLYDEIQVARYGPGYASRAQGRENIQAHACKEEHKLESWLHDFQEAWIGHMEAKDKPSSSGFPPPFMDPTRLCHASSGGGAVGSRARQRELSLSKTPEPQDAPQHSQRLWRVILGARSIFSTKPLPKLMPGVDEAELEELAKYQCGVPVHLGKMHRVRCSVSCSHISTDTVPVFMLPTQATLVLVKPDRSEPFWGVPVIVEPLRLVRLIGADSVPGPPLDPINAPGGNHEDPQRSLRFQVLSPSSPFFQAYLQPHLPAKLTAAAPTPGTVAAAAAAAERDRIAGSAGVSGVQDRCSHDDGCEAPDKKKSLLISLTFNDARRLRVGYKIFVQARQSRTMQMTEVLEEFLNDCRQSEL